MNKTAAENMEAPGWCDACRGWRMHRLDSCDAWHCVSCEAIKPQSVWMLVFPSLIFLALLFVHYMLGMLD